MIIRLGVTSILSKYLWMSAALIYVFLSIGQCLSMHTATDNRADNHTMNCDRDVGILHGWVHYPHRTVSKTFTPGSVLTYNCNRGFKLEGPSKRMCAESGLWKPDIIPSCKRVKLSCHIPNISNGKFASEFHPYEVGQTARIKCNNGKYVYIMCKQDGSGRWVSVSGTKFDPAAVCPRTRCRSPPQIPDGEWLTYVSTTFIEGSEITYQCFSGYRLVSADSKVYKPTLTCHLGNWEGKLPTCIRNIHCGHPVNIAHGTWTNNDKTNEYRFEVGYTLHYGCNHGYKLLGESVLECMSDKLWSHIAPQCIPHTDESVYCDVPVQLKHGRCECDGRELGYCQPFMPGLKVMCTCDTEYRLIGDYTLTCQADGSWSGQIPSCNKVISDNPPSSTFHVSTLAIVVATACSILGVLLFVMVIVVFRRHKPRPRLYSGTPAPPPYTRVHSSSIGEHDRLALITCDNPRNPLPSYEEATSNQNRTTASLLHMPNSRIGIAEPNSMEYRPLPPVPVSLRGSFIPATVHSPNDHRAPYAPARDALSEQFGSRDTVNVSMSDASTSVTVETYDSAASNPSTASRRVHTGSLHSSSTCSIVTEDVPLLDGNHSDSHSSQEPVDIIEETKDEEYT